MQKLERVKRRKSAKTIWRKIRDISYISTVGKNLEKRYTGYDPDPSGIKQKVESDGIYRQINESWAGCVENAKLLAHWPRLWSYSEKTLGGKDKSRSRYYKCVVLYIICKCFGSGFTESGSGSSILDWIPIRIQGFHEQKLKTIYS